MKTTIIVWQNLIEEWVEFTEKGKTKRFDTAFELINYIRVKVPKGNINLKIEQV